MNSTSACRRAIALCCLLFALLAVLPPAAAQAHDAVPHSSAVMEQVGFDQRLDAQVPGELVFRDEQGQAVALQSYWRDRPVILALSYFECESLCPLVRQGLLEALAGLRFSAGEDFAVVLVSIDPNELVESAARVKAQTVESYGRAGGVNGWHFLTGEHEAIDQLAEAIGFRYAYDGKQQEFAHPSGIVLLTPQGHVARYFFGIEYAPQDLRLGLVETSQNRIGNAIDQLLLMCYHYDPASGTYSLLIMNILRLAGLLTIAVMGTAILVMRQKDSQRPQPPFTGTFG